MGIEETTDSQKLAEEKTSSPQHPRLAVVLGVDRRYYHPLIACRSLCFVPSIWGTLKVLIAVWRVFEQRGDDDALFGCVAADLFLAVIWCFQSAYLSFLFIDALMSRWLIYYTPWATLVRLISMCALNVYLTSWALLLAGTNTKPRNLLPAWISIAVVLLIAYYFTQRNMKVVRRFYAWLSIECGAVCFFSMCILLVETHTCLVIAPLVSRTATLVK